MEGNNTKNREYMVDCINSAKQAIVITESYGDAQIDWDARSLADVQLLLEKSLDFIKTKKAEEDAKLLKIKEALGGYLHEMVNLPKDQDGMHNIKDAQKVLDDYANEIYRIKNA